MSKISIKTTLYYANWCGHCKRFEPEWDKFSEQINDMGNKIGKSDITVDKIEDNKISQGSVLINGKEIRGYPTVKISVSDDKGKTVEYEYAGKRDAKSLLNHFEKEAHNKLNSV
jgi:thiol-disulfide isomerase/thioredoxin